ncbi:unnamed protein product [Aspergillus oryzae RIB40]|uniref:DNA, SC011 n=2 Tax=Aspergillus oryzae TaxID=5062 RepID=Q2U1A8_ASPOR|nr:unnamed protein product [Aspergillus oryzae RIB40]EIT74340.1 hypothetical protein Ao3042_09590 [Aspergillus oryzae 3.042]KDE77865.1 hypothetical protein AO1008_03999 [Aspergillus oryzae 100-8]BAE64657.1 unnamed protein product [Aspergillus oryzae RIB40]|eukprot:EIT74340.1 hypothetical protein Ao3042_09590 [Aspergillus oryzae 3.042]
MAGLWLGLGFTAGKSIAITLWSAITAPFRGQTGGATAYKHVAITFARSFFGTASIEQIQLSLSENLRGALLLSPWIDFGTDHESFRTNADKDAISAESLGRWAEALFGDTKMDKYTNPTDAPTGWWKLLPVEKIFIGVGGDEVLLDSIVSLAHKMKTEHPDVLVSRVPREFHVEPITDFGLGLSPGVQYQAMAAWLNQTFSQ